MVRSFSGSIDSSDANETELFAILIGCRELLQMVGYGAILEGDSFSAIQWCSGSSSYPWRLVDWVEEVQDISRRLRATFNHILRGANIVADSLARGVFSFTLSFDV